MFVAEIKGSEQWAVRSCVFLPIARPQPPPEKKKHRNWYQNRRAGPARRVVGLSVVFMFGAVVPFVPTIALLCGREPYTWGLDR